MDNQILLLLYFFLVMSPPVILATIFVKLDIFREPLRPVVLTLIISYAATSIFGEIKYGILAIPEAWYENDVINSLFLIALPEELTKFFVLYFYCSKVEAFNEPMDGLVYGSLSGLGFAINEAFGYAYTYQVESSSTVEVIDSILMRGLIAVPGHAFDGILMGAFVGFMIFRQVNKYLFIFFAIAVPTTFHFLWDFSIFTGNGGYVYLIYLIQLMIVIILFLQFRKFQKSKIREEELKIN